MQDKKQDVHTLILDKLPLDTTAETLEKALTAAKFAFSKVEQIKQEDFEKFGVRINTSSKDRNARFKPVSNDPPKFAFFQVSFETRKDMLALSHNILFEKTTLIGEKPLHLMIHNKKGNYNSETSICVQ